MAHTPGPWEVVTYPIASDPLMLAVECRDRHVCDMTSVTKEDWDNARLIIAAPDLLAACEDARDAIATLERSRLGSTWDGSAQWYIKDELLAKLDAAIAAAKGAIIKARGE